MDILEKAVANIEAKTILIADTISASMQSIYVEAYIAGHEDGYDDACMDLLDDDLGSNLDEIDGEETIEYNEEQANYYPSTEDEEPDVGTVVKTVTAYIEDKFPNLRQEVETDAYRRIKDGGEPPILSDIACEECGEFYIASDDTYAENGTCLNCGAKHIINTCERCGSHFLGEIEEGVPSLCENCIHDIEEA